MFRIAVRFAVVALALALGVAAPAAAQEAPARGLTAPSPAVAAAWAQEARERQSSKARSADETVERSGLVPSAAAAAAWAKDADERLPQYPASGSLKVLYGAYGVLQGLDMYSTIVARQKGAREVNPVMNTGYAQASLMKGLMAAGTVAAVKKIEKKNRKAAVIAMVTMNVVTAAVVANNFRNARRLR